MSAAKTLKSGRDTVRLLLVEDNPGDRVLIERRLAKQGDPYDLGTVEVIHADSLTGMLDRLEEYDDIDIILLDLGLPESRGLETLRSARKATPQVPIVVLTGLDAQALATNAISQGADDFLRKDNLDTDALRRSLRYSIERARRSHELRVKTDAMDFAELAMLLEEENSRGEREHYVNHAFEELTGFTSIDMLERDVLDMIDHDTLDREFTDPKVLRRRGEKVRFEAVMNRADGGSFWASIGVIPISQPNGGRSQNLYTIEDVSARHEMLTRLAEFDRMITLGTLSASVAHEINNPLAYVGGNVQFALMKLEKLERERPEDQEAFDDISEALRDALDGSRRVRVVVDDLRDLAGGGLTESRKMDERVSVEESVRTSISMVRKQVEYRAKLEVDVEEELPDVLGNSAKLGQVVLNLCLNAAQAISQSRKDGRVEVRVFSEAEDVIVEVQDNGCGISPQQQKKIFDPFFSTKSSQEGTGLGLAICKQTIMRIGGKIEVDSVEGEGSTFRVILPVVEKRLRERSDFSDDALDAGASATGS